MFVEKYLNFNFKLTGLLFIQEEQREGKTFFSKTSVFKLNEYIGEAGSKVKSYYKVSIFPIKNLADWVELEIRSPSLVREEPLRCLNCIGITGCDGWSKIEGGGGGGGGSPVVYLTEISFYCQTCESPRKLLNIYQGTKCFSFLTEISSLAIARLQQCYSEEEHQSSKTMPWFPGCHNLTVSSTSSLYSRPLTTAGHCLYICLCSSNQA